MDWISQLKDWIFQRKDQATNWLNHTFTSPLHRHSCRLVGPVIDGEPVGPYNRRVIWIRPYEGSVETGDVGSVKAGRGKIVNVEYLGRLTATLSENLELVQGWVEDSFRTLDGQSMEMVIDRVRAHIAASTLPSTNEDVIQLDVFKAEVVNHTEGQVFVYREPSSW